MVYRPTARPRSRPAVAVGRLRQPRKNAGHPLPTKHPLPPSAPAPPDTEAYPVAGSNTARRLCSLPQASPPRCWCMGSTGQRHGIDPGPPELGRLGKPRENLGHPLPTKLTKPTKHSLPPSAPAPPDPEAYPVVGSNMPRRLCSAS